MKDTKTPDVWVRTEELGKFFGFDSAPVLMDLLLAEYGLQVKIQGVWSVIPEAKALGLCREDSMHFTHGYEPSIEKLTVYNFNREWNLTRLKIFLAEIGCLILS